MYRIVINNSGLSIYIAESARNKGIGMRVVIFTETFLPKMDGIVRVICLLLDHLHSQGIETLVIAPQLGDEPVREYNGSKVVTVAGIVMPWYPEARFTLPSYAVYEALQSFKPDVAHFLHPVTVGLPGFLMAKQMGLPTLMSFHLDFGRIVHHMNYGPINFGFLEPLADVLTRVFFNWADCRLAPSKQIQRQMLDLGIQDVGIWKRGVDAERFNPRFRDDAMRIRLTEGHPDETLLLYVGRLSREKRIEDLKAVLDQVPNTRLALIGDGPFREELQQIFAGTNTLFTGYLHGEELSQAYASADIFTFPSSLETFGLVVTEAMAAGVPVVASRVGGIPDVVEEGITGYTFDIGDTAGLVAGVCAIISDPQHQRAMGLAARAYAERQTWDYMMQEVVHLYEGLVREHQVKVSA